MTLYSIDGLTKVYSRRKVLDIRHLELVDNCIYALLGPNGAGKTTLLNILAFLDKPSRGQVSYRMQPVQFTDTTMQRLRKEVVVVDQHPILFSTTVFKNVEFGLNVRHVPKDRRIHIIEEVLDLVGMRSFIHAQAHRLSGGETQRVALARALAVSPKVFLCDEPTASVDIENQESILSILRQINAEKHISIVFTTHDRSQAAKLAQHTLMLDRGQLVPTTYENLFQAELETSPDGQLTCVLRGRLNIPLMKENTYSPNGRVRVYVDPEKINLDRQVHDDSDPGYKKGRVISAAEENGRVRLVIDAGVLLHVLMPKETYLPLRFAAGDLVYLNVPAAAVHVY